MARSWEDRVMSRTISRALICLGILMLVGLNGLADVIKLKDGSVLKGKVVSYSQRRFTIVVYIGGSTSQHVISVDEVESVEFDGAEAAPAAARAAVEAPVSRTEAAPAVEARPAAQPEREAGPPAAAAEPMPEAGTNTVIIEKTVTVAAGADWTSTEIRVQRGQRIVINASGEVDLGEGQRTGPGGKNIPDNRKLIPNKSTGALIAVVGDDNDDFIFIGSSSEFTAPHSGILFLSVNEGNLRDNSGSYVAQVKILSNK